MRNAAARCCFRYRRSSSSDEKVGYARTLSVLPEVVLPRAWTDWFGGVDLSRMVVEGAISGLFDMIEVQGS